MRKSLLVLAVLGLLIGVLSTTNADPILQFRHGITRNSGGGGGGGTGAGGVFAGDCATICADHANGQTFIQWRESSTGTSGANVRYRVVESASPITSSNYTSATVIARYNLNNSGQLFGGSPDGTANPWTLSGGTSRQDGTLPMSVIPDARTGLTKVLVPFTGLQVQTVPSNRTIYYGVIQTNTSDTGDVFLGSVGPITETAATPVPVKYANSGSRADNSYGKITGICTTTSRCPMVYGANQSGSTVGRPNQSQYGDYWEWWLTGAEGWQPGRMADLAVHEDDNNLYPSFTNSFQITDRDDIWNSAGTAGMETYHFGMGLSPLNCTTNCNRIYLTGVNQISRMLTWAINNYNIDPNQLHWVGISMGAWGGAHTGMRMTNPRFSTVTMRKPVWRFDRRGSANWPGSTWASTYPFKATLGTAPRTLGGSSTNDWPAAGWSAIASAVLLSDGTRWGGDGGYADLPAFIASNPGTDLPVAFWSIAKDDPYPASFLEQIETANAFKSAHRGFAFAWTMGMHNEGDEPGGAIDCDNAVAITSVCYKKSLFALNKPYPAFANSSIDDNPGTGVRQSTGIYDGDYTGCIGCGFSWLPITENSSSVTLSISNNWMSLPPSDRPTTTLSAPISSATSYGSVTLTDPTLGGLLKPVGSNPYFLIGNEIVAVCTTISTKCPAVGVSGGSLYYLTRATLGTTGQIHSAGETVRQFVKAQPTGPNNGPYTTMTVDIAFRRLQFYHPADGPISCTVTSFGGSATPKTGTVTNGIPVLTGVTINAGGSTNIVCS